jgi:P27 family predicted phage terminase small subunit
VLRLLRGNPGKRPLPQNEPELPALTGAPPAFLSPEARQEWDRIMAKVGKTGMLTEVDRMGLVVCCVAWGYFAAAATSVTQVGMLVKDPSSYPVQNPMLRIAKGWAQILARVLPEYGMTPSSRSRIAVTKKEGPSKLARLSGRNYGGGA